MNNHLGILQGRLTPSHDRGIQFFPYGEWEQEFSDAKNIGFDCLELLIQRKDWGNTDHPLLSQKGIGCIQSVVADSGISTPSIHAYYEPRETYPLELGTIARAAETIGASVVLLSFFKHAALTSPEAKETARQLLKAALDSLPQNTVRFGLEAELPASELLQFIESLSQPDRFGVYYDLGNQYACGFPVAEELRSLREKIVGIHIKDRLPQVKGEPESPSVPLGTGCANFPEAFNTLQAVGYAGPLVIQGARQDGKDDTVIGQEYYAFVKQLATKS